MVADCATATPARACTASSTRPTTAVYLYSQFEVPDARRVFATFEQPDLKARVHLHGDRAGALEGRLERPHARAEPARRRQAVWRFPATERMSTYITAIVAGEYHEVRDTYDGEHGEIPLGHLLPPVAGRPTSTPTRSFELTKQGFDFFEEAFDYPYPFEQVRPALRAGVQHGRDGERRLRDAARRVPLPPQAADALRSTSSAPTDPARDGAHVVRRPRDDEVVGRPLAQRVVRRVGPTHAASPRPPQFDEAWTGFANAREELGLPPGPAALDAPDRGRQSTTCRPSRSTSTASPTPRARSVLKQLVAWVGLERVPGRPARYFKKHAFGNTEFADLLAALERPRGRDLRLAGPRSGCRPPASTRCAPVFDADDDGRYASSPCGRPRTPSTRRCVGTGSASASTTCATGAWCVATASRSTSRASAPRCPSWSAREQPDLLLLNDDDLTYAKIRLDERSLATVVEPIAGFDDSLPAPLCWARRGT